MGYFKVDCDAVGDLASRLARLSSELESLSDETWSVAHSVARNETLNTLGYASMIREVSGVIENHAKDTQKKATGLESVVELCQSSVVKVAKALENEEEAADISYANPMMARFALTTAIPDSVKQALIEEGEILVKNSKEVKKLMDDSRLWRSTEGSKHINKLYERLDEIHPLLKELVEEKVEEYNKKLANYEDMLKGALSPSNPGALALGGKAFLDEAGFGWLPQVGERLKKQTDFYVERGAQQIREGNVLKGIGTAIGGSLASFGDMVIDTTARTIKTVAKGDKVVGPIYKGVNSAVEFMAGSTAEDLVDNTLGAIGNGIKSALEQITR